MIAEVALGLPLRRTWDYLVGAELAGRLQPGCRVIVPLGSRLKGGIVVALKESSAIAPQRLKPVQQVTEGPPLFLPEQLVFARWLADYYLCGWGEVLEAALPSGLGVRIRTHYRLHQDAAPQELERLSPGVRVWVQRLRASGSEFDLAQWQRHGPTAEDDTWLGRQSRAGGLLAVRQEFAGTRQRPRLEKWARLAPHPPPEQPPLLPARRRNPLKETRQDQALRVLQEEGEVPLARLRALLPNPGAVLKPLIARGLVQVLQRPGPGRLPFGPRPAPQPFFKLNPDQQAAFATLLQALRQGQGQPAGAGYQGFLLEGVTGSGKTEVYLHLVRETLAAGRSCLVLVPEIALTADMVNRFRSRFGERVAVLHSGLGEGERFEEWNRVRQGLAPIVIGARSAVFAPLAGLGLVVVDEEHDGSYKQDEAPRYHGRDAAIWRASRAGALLVLGSATPSLETLRNVELGKLTRLVLPERVQSRALPQVQLLDLRTAPRQSGSAWFTLALVQALRETLARQEQAIVFLNRRGFAHLVRCGECQHTLACEQCSIALTWHQAEGRLRCHRCDFSRPMPQRCPACQAEALKVLGLGTERIQQELAMMFPEARLVRVDSDSLRRRGELDRVLEAIRRHEYDLIIGTQILTKGHDFPLITLVGAVLADVSLNLPDFRAPERTFQVLTQMAGRAGRGERPGRVLIQTYSPEHYSLSHVLAHDPQGFARDELRVREAAQVPPFVSQALLWVSSEDARAAQQLAQAVGRQLRAALDAADGGVQMLGPAEAPIRRIAKRWRWMILLKAQRPGPLHAVLRRVLDEPAYRPGPKDRVVVDVDPYQVL